MTLASLCLGGANMIISRIALDTLPHAYFRADHPSVKIASNAPVLHERIYLWEVVLGLGERNNRTLQESDDLPAQLDDSGPSSALRSRKHSCCILIDTMTTARPQCES